MKAIIFCLVFVAVCNSLPAQDSTVHTRSLDSVILVSFLNQQNIRPLPAIQGTYLFAGKKTELIDLAQAPADLSNKSGRQLFSRIPGIFVYDMDGAGNQVNISARGLDPHRGWEFNIRKDGILTNSDMYGYPASHYSMPMESISRIELVRGTGSLQYGAQFGGMLNYISKQGDTTRPVSFESINSVGSYNLVSSYNAIGGKKGKWSYYAYLHKKTKDGYRDNEHTDSEAEAVILNYTVAPRLSIRAEWARSRYLYRIPGALTDSMFRADPRQSTRSRNYFSPDIHIPSLTLNWQPAAQTKIQLTVSAVLGKRNSVLFDKPTQVRDTINTATLRFNNRQVDIDRFNSYTTELRFLQEYRSGRIKNTLSAGLQLMNNDLHRTQLGKGSTGSDYDLALVDPQWGRDLHFKTTNVALFAENNFRLSPALSFNLGARAETGKTDMNGTITYYPGNEIPVRIEHRFPLFGGGLSFKPTDNMELYAGFSQAYRPMLFKDLVPGSLYEKVDPAIKDAKGYNAEAGFRGSWRFFKWDITGFLLRYNNRFGTLAEMDNNGNFYTYRTNTGNSLTKGIEALVQADWLSGNKFFFSVFTSTALVHARYTRGSVKSGNANIDIAGNKIESAPGIISRNGITARYRKYSVSVLYSYTGETFADALNTPEPAAATGAVGPVPSYGLLDMSLLFRISKNLDSKLTISNLADKQYFTKRPLFYPGPGVWPSEGRNYNFTFSVRL
ncbi:MAG: TonB-dependent receptor [Sphingobacteriales bacterium]|nr:TonB-dependent receptor [Sphingobacteriales bacterium]